jgi:FkbM family methyltransferase
MPTDGTIKKVFRTLQSEFAFLKETKDSLYLYGRRRLAIPHERDFRAVARIPISTQGCFVDVGANQGQSIQSILLAQPTAKIVSFEANPVLSQTLASRYKNQDNVLVISKGLSDSAGTFTLFVPSYKGFVYDGLASLDRYAAASWINEKTVFRFDPSKLTVAELHCTVDTLDAHQLAPVFIKVDVQGCEYNVLNGGKETLRRYEPVLLVEAFRSDPRTVQLLEELGYEEYYFDGSFLRKGSHMKGLNSFLITPGKIETLFGLSEPLLMRLCCTNGGHNLATERSQEGRDRRVY